MFQFYFWFDLLLLFRMLFFLWYSLLFGYIISCHLVFSEVSNKNSLCFVFILTNFNKTLFSLILSYSFLFFWPILSVFSTIFLSWSWMSSPFFYGTKQWTDIWLCQSGDFRILETRAPKNSTLYNLVQIVLPHHHRHLCHLLYEIGRVNLSIPNGVRFGDTMKIPVVGPKVINIPKKPTSFPRLGTEVEVVRRLTTVVVKELGQSKW